jgi:hypothetical protein
MKKALPLLLGLLLAPFSLAAEPYTFTPDDYIEYGIFFSARGSSAGSSGKLLTLRYGDIETYYTSVIPTASKIPTPKQELRLSTARGSVRVNRNDNLGVTVTRDTHNERRRTGTKRLEIRFENGTCTDQQGVVTSPCVVDLLLETESPDKGVVRQPRTLTITTSTGLTFKYRSLRTDGGKPINLALRRRSPTINNFAWEWRGPQE